MQKLEDNISSNILSNYEMNYDEVSMTVKDRKDIESFQYLYRDEYKV